MRTRVQHVSIAAAGFTLIEVVLVVGLIAVLSAITVMMMPGALLSARADSGIAQVVSTLRVAREEAIAQRRNVRVAFAAPNRVVVSRVEVPGPGVTVIHETVARRRPHVPGCIRAFPIRPMRLATAPRGRSAVRRRWPSPVRASSWTRTATR